MKILWTGSDVLYATRFIGGIKFPSKKSKYPYFLAMTIFAKIADFFVQEHYVVSEHLIEELKPLKLKKPIKVLIDPPLKLKGIKKIEHRSFNILYYIPNSKNIPFTEWVYGWDIFSSVYEHYYSDTRVHFQIIDGKQDMKYYYPLTDVYIRPNRHDGAPRMVMECRQLDIPVCISTDVDDIISFIEKEINNKIISDISKKIHS